jgi:hypothetical protein
MRLVYLALVGVLLVTTVSFAAQQTCDEQMIIKRCEADSASIVAGGSCGSLRDHRFIRRC